MINSLAIQAVHASGLPKDRNRIGGLVIVDENGQPMSIITDRELIRDILKYFDSTCEANILNYWFNREEQRQKHYRILRQHDI